jgi:glycosyltransferase involved in cell wall biosynthesis
VVHNYILTTPVRNEMVVLPGLISMMDALEPKPALWLVVDDGSTDGSDAFLESAARTRPWMEVAPAPEKAEEYLGGHIARIKRWGLEQARTRCEARGVAVEFLGVLDADLELPSDHYARLIDAFENDPALGVVSSLVTSPSGEVEPFQRLDLPRGGTQFFRKTCLDAIGGLPPYPGFDGAANVKAQHAGFRTRLIPEVKALHHRPTATRFGAAPGFERKGKYAWFLGMHPLLIAARTVGYALKRPHAGGFHFLKGWAKEALRGAPRCPDEVVLRENGWRRVAKAGKAALGIGTRYAPP